MENDPPADAPAKKMFDMDMLKKYAEEKKNGELAEFKLEHKNTNLIEIPGQNDYVLACFNM